MDKSKLKKIGVYILLAITLLFMVVAGNSFDSEKKANKRKKK